MKNHLIYELFNGAGFVLMCIYIYSHFIRYEPVFAHFKEPVHQWNFRVRLESILFRKNWFFAKETFLSCTENTGFGLSLLSTNQWRQM